MVLLKVVRKTTVLLKVARNNGFAKSRKENYCFCKPRLYLSAAKTSIVTVGKTSAMSAARTSAFSAAKTSAVKNGAGSNQLAAARGVASGGSASSFQKNNCLES